MGVGRAGKALVGVACALLVASTSGAAPVAGADADVPLVTSGVVHGPGAHPVALPADAGPRPPDTPEAAWLAAGTLPGPERYRDMAARALLDLRDLTETGGAPIAAPVRNWWYVWPRDASFAAVALTRTGHRPEALAALTFLARVQEPDGTFQARYLPDASGVPDDRGEQLDGCGWALWAVAEWWSAADGAERTAARGVLAPLVSRSVRAVAAHLDPGGLPGASRDYWEVPETRLTLGTVAPLVAGLRAAADGGAGLLDAADLERTRTLCDTLAAAMERRFAPTWPRHAGGWALDAAVTFAAPPFGPDLTGEPVRRRAWEASLRPAGGVAPGRRWKRDGISWTPETALFGLAAAATGDRAWAESVLTWLDAHRTGVGSLPEKVLADGRPAGPAPLGWTAALVLLTLSELDRS